MEHIQITTPGIKKALSRYKWYDAIAEYVWNGFDAKATLMDITWDRNEIGSISQITVADNGYGIAYDQLRTKFIPFFESDKEIDPAVRRQTSAVHGKTGVGRLTFYQFASVATWATRYQNEGPTSKEYLISVDSETLHTYSTTEPMDTDDPPGTIVTFQGITQITAYHMETELGSFLMRKFGWFLELNKSRGFKLRVNGTELDYSGIIGDTESFNLKYDETATTFDVRYVRWKDRINDEYSRYYYLDSHDNELFKAHTTLNNKGDHFYHSVFIKSRMFDEFNAADSVGDLQLSLIGQSKRSPEFRFLMEKVDLFLRRRRKPFLKLYTDKLIADFQQNEAFPAYNVHNIWERTRRSELENVVRELYQVQPKIFSDLNLEQKKTFVRLLDLVIDAGEKDRLFDILKDIVDLDASERDELARLLQKSRLTAIISTIRLIEDRYKAVEELKSLVFNKALQASERDHLQKSIEKHYWVFGEQYHLVTSADARFEQALRRFVYLLRGEKTARRIDHADKDKEMDIFAVRQDLQNNIIKNVVVELKHPSVNLGKKQTDQVDAYLNVVLKQDEFNAPNMFWEFHLVGNSFDETGYIERLFENAKNHGERSLIFKTDRYKTYVKKWSEVFAEFDIRHKFLNDKLGVERDGLLANGATADQLVSSLGANTAVQPFHVEIPQ